MNIQIFNFNEAEIQVLLDDNNEPWWIATDVCYLLEISNATKALSTIPDRNKLPYPLVRAGQKRTVNLINESGLYRLIAKSRKPEAERFQDWIFEEVLPSIRKTGSYGNQLPSDPKEQALLLATQLIESQKEIESLETTVKELTPKAEFHDQVTAREGWKPLSQFGKVSGIGFQRIFDFCEDLNLLYFSNGNRIPKTAVQKLGFLDLKEDNYKDKYGRVHTTYKVFVSGKGESLILQEWNKINRMSLFN